MKLHEVAKRLRPHAEIKNWLDNHYIKNYTIRPDGVVDVDGHTEVRTKEKILPVQFGIITSTFSCEGSYSLISIKGFPQYVHHDFFCDESGIKSLSGIDKVIKEIKGGFYCDRDVTHILGLLLVKGITKFDIDSEGPIDRIMNKYIGTGDILSAQDELIDAGFTDQARL
jgi:hypothetical protein